MPLLTDHTDIPTGSLKKRLVAFIWGEKKLPFALKVPWRSSHMIQTTIKYFKIKS